MLMPIAPGNFGLVRGCRLRRRLVHCSVPRQRGPDLYHRPGLKVDTKWSGTGRLTTIRRARRAAWARKVRRPAGLRSGSRRSAASTMGVPSSAVSPPSMTGSVREPDRTSGETSLESSWRSTSTGSWGSTVSACSRSHSMICPRASPASCRQGHRPLPNVRIHLVSSSAGRTLLARGDGCGGAADRATTVEA